MLVGTDADYQLRSYLQERDPGRWSGNTTLGGLFGDGRPDLIYDDAPRQVFEIKPDGADARGAAQLQGYLNTPGAGSVAGDFALIFRDRSSIPLSGGWFGETTYTYQPGAFPGVVTYKVDNTDVFQQALRLFTQRPMGGPLLLPPRMPPLLIP